jgi:hypothetical protein
MEFIRTLFKTNPEKQETKRQNTLRQQAEELITVTDFADSLYIAYNGTPLAPIDPSWTTKEIVQQLSIFRNNFINSKMDELHHPRVTAML